MSTDLSVMADNSGAIEAVQAGAIESITRAEIDVQVATAKRFPRSIARFLQEASSMVAATPDIAAACRYSLPARKGSSERIEGSSVRLAEIVAACWGNLRIQGRIVGDDGKMVTAQGVAIDLERNVAYSVEVKRGVAGRDGRRYTDDMVRLTCLAAIAIATRNATFKVVPTALVDSIADAAIAVARGDVRTLPERLDKALRWFASKGANEARMLEALGVAGRADVTLDHLQSLNEWRTAIQDGVATLAEVLPAPQSSAPNGKGLEGLAARHAAPTSATATPAIEAPREREPGED